MVDSKLKLKALLHDPIDKQYIMWELREKHEEKAEKYFRNLIDESLKDENVHIADQIASAISRVIVAPNLEGDLKENFEKESLPSGEIKFIDPFSLRVENYGKPDNANEVMQFFENLGSCTFRDQDERVKIYFLFLWRFLPEIFPWINTHPADSRAPNHSIYDHLVQTSAIVSALSKPAFLLFTIGPVQEFISTARKASDLWAGSYILSYLTYKAIEVILEELGPDNVVYPNLLGNPLVDGWIYEKIRDTEIIEKFENEKWFNEFRNNAHSEEHLTIANFPNRFLAIVPFDKAKNIGDECARRIIGELERWGDEIICIDELKSLNIDKSISDVIKSQLKNYFQIYYVYLPWFNSDRSDVQTILDEYRNLIGENEIYRVVELINQHSYYKPASVGVAYSLLCELTERFLASRKMYRDFGNIEEQAGEKCHLCGNYEILEVDWEKLKREIVREKERLCGVCFIKRVFPIISSKILSIGKVKFPSTSEIATILWKLNLKENESLELKDKFEKFKDKVKEIPEAKSVPKLKGHPLCNIDGQWFFETSYREDYLKREYGIKEEDINNAKKEIEEILEILKSFPKAPTYYAILMMDGDEMGKWLKGEKMAKIGELIDENTKNVLLKYSSGDDRERLQEILCSKHPISASIHQGFSRRLTNFAIGMVRDIVESNYGKLIYAGGDDVLAFLPVQMVMSCAYNLQREFKNILGERSSMSAGIVIAHHKYPLGIALNKVRWAEHRAKSEYNRDSFCIVYLSRGGEERVTGGKWEIKEFFEDLVCLFSTKKISKGFGYEVLETVRKLDEKELLKVELKRILSRKFNRKMISGAEIDKYKGKILNALEKFSENPEEFANMILIVERIV